MFCAIFIFQTRSSQRVSMELQNKRWSTEITAQDKMFFEKLA